MIFPADINAHLSNFNKVADFHRTSGHPVLLSPSAEHLNKKMLNARYSFIEEEVNELVNAWNSDDVVEQIDAICDIMYFAYGTFLTTSAVFNHKLVVESSPNSEFEFTDAEDFKNYLEILRFSFNSFDLDAIEHSLHTLLHMCYIFAHTHFPGVDIDDCFAEVHNSNMSKFCDIEQDAIDTCAHYERSSRTTNYRLVNGRFVVFDVATDKILKNVNWRTPNLRQFLVTAPVVLTVETTEDAPKVTIRDILMEVDQLIKNKEITELEALEVLDQKLVKYRSENRII